MIIEGPSRIILAVKEPQNVAAVAISREARDKF